MSGSLAASAFFPGPGPSPATSVRSSKNTAGELPDNLSVRGIVAKPNPPPRAMQVKAQAQALPKVNGTKVNHKTTSQDNQETVPHSAPKTFYNQLPDWSIILAAITTIFLAAEKQWTLVDWKPKRPDMLVDTFGFGRIIQDGLVFRQNFLIRSYEIGADRTASIETLMNHLQETALNHVKTAGLLGDGFGATPEMSKRNLIWVVSKIQLAVEQYPSWGDMVQVDTWVAASGKNGMRRDWHVRDYNSGQTILRATSVWVMMNKKTRRLSKMPEEVRAEIGPYFNGRSAITAEQSERLAKTGNKIDGGSTDKFIRKGLTPRWSDLDVNQHVNNVKYIGWILEPDAEAMRDGLRLVPQDITENVIVETDSQELVALWRSRLSQRSEVAVVLDDIENIAEWFTSFSVVHVRRTANIAAHLCARNATVMSPGVVWVAQPPSFLQCCMQTDCNAAS